MSNMADRTGVRIRAHESYVATRDGVAPNDPTTIMLMDDDKETGKRGTESSTLLPFATAEGVPSENAVGADVAE